MGRCSTGAQGCHDTRSLRGEAAQVAARALCSSASSARKPGCDHLSLIASNNVKPTSLAGALACFAILGGSAIAQGDRPTSIFDGKSLSGWRGNAELWSVQDGILVGSTEKTKTKANTFLIWEGEVADFELVAEFRLSGKNNSGVQYRSQSLDRVEFGLRGYQADIHSNPPYTAMLYEERGRGILVQRGQRGKLLPRRRKQLENFFAPKAIDLSQWRTLKIIAKGERLRHYIDGELAIDVVDEAPAGRMRGKLGLQLHAGAPMRIEFRRIVLTKTGSSKKPVRAETVPPRPRPKGKLPTPQWLWLGEAKGDEVVFFRKTIDLPKKPKNAVLVGSCDNRVRVWINGKLIGASGKWEEPFCFEATAPLRAGRNVIAVRSQNAGGPAGFVARFETDELAIASDASWRASTKRVRGWRARDFDDSSWAKAKELFPLGRGPWSGYVHERSFDTAGVASSRRGPLITRSRKAPNVEAPEGFVVEELATIPKYMGSWVSLAKGPDGVVFAAAQRGGLYKVTPSSAPDGTHRIEKVGVELAGVHGLHWSQGVLYAMVNGGKSGFYRIVDDNGDGKLDDVEMLRRFHGAGEHGPHAIVDDPHGKGFLINAGNYTALPDFTHTRLPERWGEDLVVPRLWDPRGHARGLKAPGGWLARISRDGKEVELICSGFRNAFDLAVSPQGEIFTYDADMEWDFGTPWYRPTRICHAVSGADFGWRAGNGKWPTYYEDSLPPTVEIGPGSPTGLLFGTEAAFPPRYRNAMYALDWTFGTMWAIWLQPDGASYTGKKSPFLTGKPLPLCDAVIGGDGAMYFVTGGRGLQSKLYRVSAKTEGEAAHPREDITSAQALRRRIEALHAKGAAYDASVFDHLGSEDRFVAHAARVALELQPIAKWKAKALAIEPSQAMAKLRALIALARCGDKSTRAEIMRELDRVPFAEQSPGVQLCYLRVLALVELRIGPLSRAERARAIARLAPVFGIRGTGGRIAPTRDARVARELCKVLARLDATGLVAPAIARMESAPHAALPDWATLASRNDNYGSPIRRMLANPPPTEGLHYADALRSASGWTIDERRRYFAFLNKARRFPGGASYPGFIERFRRRMIDELGVDERAELQPTLRAWFLSDPKIKVTPPKGPAREWTLAEAEKLFAKPLSGRSYKLGKNFFRATQCFRCHRFDGEGGSVGPDLSTIAQRFGAKGLLESIIDPDKAISDQYVGHRVVTKDGDEYEGLVVDLSKGKPNGQVEIWPREADEDPIKVRKKEIISQKTIDSSPMPKGLVDPLNPEELKDLVAYILSGGNPKHAVFQKK